MIKQLTPTCYAILQPISNQYLIKSNNQWVLIDAGLAGNQRTLLRHIRKTIPANEKLSIILITHSDADHCGGAAYIRDNTGAQVFSSALEVTAMRNGKMSRPLTPKWWQKPFYLLLSPLFSTEAVHSVSILQPGMSLPGATDFQVIDSQGHTPGHISFYWKPQGFLFAGDSIRKLGDSPAPSSGANTWDAAKSIQSFSTQLKLTPAIIACGHALFDFREA